MAAMPRRRFRPFWRGGRDKEALQLFKEHSSTWAVEMQMLKYKVDNVCSQIQMLSGHLENTSADIRMVKGVLEDAGTCHIQTQMLRISLEGAVAEIQGLRRALEKANTLNSQTQDFLQSSSENTSFVLHMLSQDLEDANAEIQLLKTQMLEKRLKEAQDEIQRLKVNVSNTNSLSLKIQEQESSLETLRAACTSQEQLQRTQTQYVQFLQDCCKFYCRSLHYFFDVKKCSEEAEQFCASQGAHLASVSSEEEQVFEQGTVGQLDNGNGHTEDCVHPQQMWSDV
ncbi:C-type lectin domain family 4 member F-like [Dasypus novemcinctus]|uniref:C-type lectin domain family 4 member F-like n=1 Tax=Dasypus novemcinctus TaxID=9361 RepID=UPI00265D8EA1|nr:C-type lectin domain family 4 member F-like [Dasypus novemcinctus]